MKQKYIDNYHALKNLPIVQKLILKNKQLKKENKNLRNALSLLGEVKCKTICKYSNDNSDIISIYSDDTEENITYSVEKKTDVITNKKTDVITDNNYKNTIIKTLIWRCIATVITFTLGWTITGSIKAGLAIGSVDTVIKTFAYFGYERLWLKLKK